jgi:predicted NBD/HSP70 family sugar kinase
VWCCCRIRQPHRAKPTRPPHEDLGSGSGLARRASEAGLAAVDARDAEAAARAGDHKAKEILEDAITACAAGVASLVFSFSPDTVVIRRRPALVGAAHPGAVDSSTLREPLPGKRRSWYIRFLNLQQNCNEPPQMRVENKCR